MITVVVSDTSPLRALDHVKRLELLNSLFSSVIVPPAVVAELKEDHCWPRIEPWVGVKQPMDTAYVAKLRLKLDEGESEAIALARELRPDFILIDEMDGRAQAEAAGFQPLGFLGILLRAKAAGFVPRVAPLIERVVSELNFFTSERLIRDVLRQAGE